MTSISSVSYPMVRQSPMDRLESTLQSQVDAGTISSDDETVLSSALETIDSTLGSNTSAAASGTPPSPDEMQSRINDLIQGLVDDGSLTTDQASELSDVFASTFDSGSGEVDGMGPPPPPPGGAPSGAPPSGGVAGASSSEDDGSDIEDLLTQLQSALTESTSYAQSGIAQSSVSSGYLFDMTT